MSVSCSPMMRSAARSAVLHSTPQLPSCSGRRAAARALSAHVSGIWSAGVNTSPPYRALPQESAAAAAAAAGELSGPSCRLTTSISLTSSLSPLSTRSSFAIHSPSGFFHAAQRAGRAAKTCGHRQPCEGWPLLKGPSTSGTALPQGTSQSNAQTATRPLACRHLLNPLDDFELINLQQPRSMLARAHHTASEERRVRAPGRNSRISEQSTSVHWEVGRDVAACPPAGRRRRRASRGEA